MRSDRVRVVCTDKGMHGPRDLGLIVWTPESDLGEAVVWSAHESPEAMPEAMSQSGRTTAAGTWRATDRQSPVTMTVRSDGGRTFTFPSCPTCKGRSRQLRDDTLAQVRDTLGTLDVSRIP